jgi:non-heme chloroperoxidase
MSTLTTRDGAVIDFKDWGSNSGRPVVLSHGWPLCSDAWDPQALFLAERGFRVVAHDRRGHGRSSQPWTGNDFDTWSDDLSELIHSLNLRDVTLVGHSTGGGEVVRYLSRHGVHRVARLVLLGAVTPVMIRSDQNPDGIPKDVFDGMRAEVRANRAELFRAFPEKFYGYNRPGAKRSQGVIDSFWRQGMMAGIKAVHDCIAQFSETDFTEELKALTLPVLIAHGDDDQIVPAELTAKKTAELIAGATLKLYPGGSHGLALTHAEDFNRDLLAFIEGATAGAQPTVTH